MAEITNPGKHEGKRRMTPPRVDFTPMVDLGFLLITFFMFTTTLTESRCMSINMPVPESGSPMAFIDTATLTIIPVAQHQLAYYHGAFRGQMEKTDFGSIRGILAEKKAGLKRLPSEFSPAARKLHVIIKPDDSARYDDLVSILDEMTISQVPVYVIDELTAEEKQALGR